jgi:hypothetical protein
MVRVTGKPAARHAWRPPITSVTGRVPKRERRRVTGAELAIDGGYLAR